MNYQFPETMLLKITPDIQRKGLQCIPGFCAVAEGMRAVPEWADGKFFSVDRDGARVTKNGLRALYDLDSAGMRLVLENDDDPKYRKKSGKRLRTIEVRLTLAHVRPQAISTRDTDSYELQKKKNKRKSPVRELACFLKRRVNGKVRHVAVPA